VSSFDKLRMTRTDELRMTRTDELRMTGTDKLRMTRTDKLILRQAQDDRRNVTLSLSKRKFIEMVLVTVFRKQV